MNDKNQAYSIGKEIENIDNKINELKQGLYKFDIYFNSIGRLNLLADIGDLIRKQNKLTGKSRDEICLLRMDGEYEEFKGFLGDEIQKDYHGNPLKCGDTYEYIDPFIMGEHIIRNDGINEHEFEFMPVKIKDYTELNPDVDMNMRNIKFYSCKNHSFIDIAAIQYEDSDVNNEPEESEKMGMTL